MSDTATAANVNTGNSYGSFSYRSYVLGTLLLAYIFNFIDRVIIAYLSVPIKAEFDLANWQFGLLSGIAFATFYTFLGIPIARLAERHNRTLIIGCSIILWSLMTALCGIAWSFLALLIFRLGVGVGEAGLTPPANSLIADYYKPEKRASALSTYSTGVTIGSFSAALFVGLLLGVVDWRTTFILVGLAGIPLGLMIIFTIKEPPRGYSDAPGTTRPTPPSISEALTALAKNKTFWFVTFGGTAASFVGYALVTFVMEFVTKAFSMDVPTAALFFLAPLALTGAVGTWLCGALADHLKGKSALWLPAVGLCLAFLLQVLALNWVTSAWIILVILLLANLFQYFYLGPMYAVSGSVVDTRMRATAIAILLFVVNLIGYGIGPPFAGLVIDMFYAGNLSDVAGLTAETCRLASDTLTEAQIAQCGQAELSAIRIGLALVTAIFVIGAAFFALAMKTVDHDLAKLREQ
nr:MFS transporter [Hyphomonas sp. Mor2]